MGETITPFRRECGTVAIALMKAAEAAAPLCGPQIWPMIRVLLVDVLAEKPGAERAAACALGALAESYRNPLDPRAPAAMRLSDLVGTYHDIRRDVALGGAKTDEAADRMRELASETAGCTVAFAEAIKEMNETAP